LKTLKTIMQLGGMAAVVYAIYNAWHGLMVKDAIVSSLASLNTVQGPNGQVPVMVIAQSMPQRLLATPWFFIGMTLILTPYLIEMLARALPQPAAKRY
jgi:hypothetical protein